MSQSREGVLTRLRAWVRDPVKKVQVRFLRQKQWVVKTLVCCCFCCFNFCKPTCAAKIFCKKKRMKLSSPLTSRMGNNSFDFELCYLHLLWYFCFVFCFFCKRLCLLALFKSRLALSRFSLLCSFSFFMEQMKIQVQLSWVGQSITPLSTISCAQVERIFRWRPVAGRGGLFTFCLVIREWGDLVLQNMAFLRTATQKQCQHLEDCKKTGITE